MSRHRRSVGLLAILARLGWQRDPGLWSVPCRDGHGHRARLSVRLGMGWVTLDCPAPGPLYLRHLQVWRLRVALREAVIDLELLGGAEPLDQSPWSGQAGAVAARRTTVVLGSPVTRPTVADIAASLAAPVA